MLNSLAERRGEATADFAQHADRGFTSFLIVLCPLVVVASSSAPFTLSAVQLLNRLVPRMIATCRSFTAFALFLCIAADVVAADKNGQLEIRAVDKATGKPLTARMHLKDGGGKPVKPPKLPFWKDHFAFDGIVILELPPGKYTFEMECGPEYKLMTGNFEILRAATDNKIVEMERFVEMKKEGWWSGDLHIHRPPEDIELLIRAEDLHIGPVITWWNNQNLWKDKPRPDKPLVQFDG